MSARLFLCKDCDTLTMGHSINCCRRCKSREVFGWVRPTELSMKNRKDIQDAERAYSNALITSQLKRGTK
jgi:hypothetical protein